MAGSLLNMTAMVQILRSARLRAVGLGSIRSAFERCGTLVLR